MSKRTNQNVRSQSFARLRLPCTSVAAFNMLSTREGL